MSDTLRGVLWMSGTVLSFSAMVIAARQLLQHLGVFEILFFRTGVTLLIVLAFALRSGVQTPVCLAAALTGWAAPGLPDLPWIAGSASASGSVS